MQTAQDSNAPLSGDGAQDVEHAFSCLRIEAGNRLISQDEPALLGQYTGNRNALLLTARESISSLRSIIKQPYAIKRRQR